MPDYKAMYIKMVKESEKAIEYIEKYDVIKPWRTLTEAQRACEEMYIESDDE